LGESYDSQKYDVIDKNVITRTGINC